MNLNFHFTKFKICVIVIILPFVLLAIYYLFVDAKLSEQIKLDASILMPVSNLHLNLSDLPSHNSNLISTLQEREASDINSILSVDDGIRQNRSIYIGILGILLTLIFSKKKRYRTYIIYIVPLCIIILFYGLDIHFNDVLKRRIESRKIFSDALDTIIQEAPSDSTWYNISYSQRDSLYEVIVQNRYQRKIKAIFHPDIVQDIYFIFPFLITYFLFAYWCCFNVNLSKNKKPEINN